MKDFEQIARKFLEACSADFDSETSVKGEIVENNSTSFTLLTPDYIQFAKYGRGPGKKPPLDNILGMVKSKSIKFDKLDERGTAFAIQASIGAKGTLNFVANAPNFVEETVSKYQSLYEKELNDQVHIEIVDQYMESLKKIWEEEDRLFKKVSI